MKINPVFIICLLLNTPLHASDIDREQRMANEIADSVMDGEVIYLQAASHSFLSIYMPTEITPAKGAIIILHGRGFHPDWEDVVYPLRTGLPEKGWHTLSIQMPVLDKNAKYYDYLPIIPESFPRLEAAVQFLKNENIHNIILIAHSCSVHMSTTWLEENPDRDINAYIGIGIGATDYKQPMKKPFAFQQLNFPVLDIFGSNDYPAVTKQAARRLEQIKQAGHPKSVQRQVTDADHYFTDKGEELLKEITAWLDTL